MKYRFHRILAVMVGLLQLVQVVHANGEAVHQKQSGTLGALNAKYSLNLQGCPIEFSSKPGGYTGRDSMNSYSGGYQHDSFERKFDLSISFDCIEEPATKYCPDQLSVKEDDPSTLRLMQVSKYNNINSAYEGGALATTLTAVNPPRGRDLAFCIGDGERTLIGHSIVGTERRAYTNEVLRILGSIRFSDSKTLPK